MRHYNLSMSLDYHHCIAGNGPLIHYFPHLFMYKDKNETESEQEDKDTRTAKLMHKQYILMKILSNHDKGNVLIMPYDDM